MNARRGLVSHDLSSCGEVKETRLYAVDFLRGVALTVVLLDHVDWFARGHGNGFFRDWTLMGLGFSDAAEVFVFLSGLTFGWVYSGKAEGRGVWCVQSKISVRSLQIYVGYLVVVAVIELIALVGGEVFAVTTPAGNSGLASGLKESAIATIVLARQPFAVGILCLYVVILPFLPVWLALLQRSSFLAFALSIAMYVAVQVSFQLDSLTLFRQWHFNPLAWQLLFVLGVAIGHWGRRGKWRLPRNRLCVFFASSVLLWGVAFRKCLQLPFDIYVLDCAVSQEFLSPFLSKMNSGPLRLLHFLSLAYVVANLAPDVGGKCIRWFDYPFVLCGKNSLSVYCVGVVLAYLSAFAFCMIGTTAVGFSLVVIDACVLHFLAACMFDRRASARRLETVPQGRVSGESPAANRAF